MSDVSLELLFRQGEQILSELKKVRSDVADVRTHTLQVGEYARRLDRRLSELGDDLAVMLKGELVGRLGHFEITVDNRLEELSSRLTAIEEALPQGNEGSPRPI
jgi:hypothetical protein